MARPVCAVHQQSEAGELKQWRLESGDQAGEERDNDGDGASKRTSVVLRERAR